MNKKPLALILSIITSLSITLEIGSGAFAFEKDPIEIVSKRSEYEKYFDNGDGTVTAIINTVPLHYLDNGEWLEIDNTLTLNESGNYINKSNSMNVTLSPITCAKSVSDIDNKQMMEIESDGYSMAWDFVNNSYQTTISNNLLTPISQISVNDDKKVNNISDNAKSNEITTKSLNKLESDVTYSSIYKSVDIDIAINSSSVNETIILNDHNSLPEKFTYYIEAKDLNAKIYEDNSIHFINVEGIEIFNIPVMFMYDSSEEPENNYNVGIDIEGYKDGYLLTIIPDKNWLLSDEINYPVMITHQVCKYTHVNSSYVSENDPDTNFVNDSLLVGGKSGFCNSAFLSIPDTFAGLGKNSDIIEASCNIFFSSNDHIGHNPNIHVGMMNYLPDKLTWNTTRNDSVYTPFYTIKIPEYSLGYYNIDITSIAHNWLNYAQTNALAGAGSPTYGIKLSTLGGSNDRTLYAYSSRSSVHAPYFEIKYTSEPTYTFGFSPYKYNKKGTTNNFQNRMNCYSYALQTYYAGELSQGEYYKLYPGEIGLSQTSSSYKYSISTFKQLADSYKSFNNINDYLNFTEEQMKKDAGELGYTIDKFEVESTFQLPISFDPNSERIIALVGGYASYSGYDYHFYVRNGNGTCPDHGGTCSIWSHKPGNSTVKSESIDSMTTLCDENIYVKSQEGIYYTNPRFYTITLDASLYNLCYMNGHDDNSTGTPYYKE